MSTLSSSLKNYPGLKVRQAENTNIWLPNIEKVYIQFSAGDIFRCSLSNALGFKALNYF